MALTEYYKAHIFKHIFLFGLTMFARYLTYMGIAITVGVWLAVLLLCVLIVADVYGLGPQIGVTMQGLYADYQNNPGMNSLVAYVKPYIDSIGGFSLIVFVVGLFFHYTFRNKKVLTTKQAFLLATIPTLVAFIFVTIHIDDLLHLQNRQALLAQVMTLIMGFIIWLVMCALILFTRMTDSVITALEKADWRMQ